MKYYYKASKRSRVMIIDMWKAITCKPPKKSDLIGVDIEELKKGVL